jgi:hypothetical protein
MRRDDQRRGHLLTEPGAQAWMVFCSNCGNRAFVGAGIASIPEGVPLGVLEELAALGWKHHPQADEDSLLRCWYCPMCASKAKG